MELRKNQKKGCLHFDVTFFAGTDSRVCVCVCVGCLCGGVKMGHPTPS